MSAQLARIAEYPERYAVPFEPEWPSVCFSDADDNGLCQWRPVPQKGENTFASMEAALSLPLNDDVKMFYTSWYSLNIKVTTSVGSGELLQVISTADFDMLQENLIGHLLMQKQLRLAPTLFIGVLDESDAIISVDNATGIVGVEYPGKPIHLTLGHSLAMFIDSVSDIPA